jgi:hypothetical protein
MNIIFFESLLLGDLSLIARVKDRKNQPRKVFDTGSFLRMTLGKLGRVCKTAPGVCESMVGGS